MPKLRVVKSDGTEINNVDRIEVWYEKQVNRSMLIRFKLHIAACSCCDRGEEVVELIGTQIAYIEAVEGKTNG